MADDIRHRRYKHILPNKHYILIVKHGIDCPKHVADVSRQVLFDDKAYADFNHGIRVF